MVKNQPAMQGHMFDPCSVKIPHAAGPLNPGPATTESTCTRGHALPQEESQKKQPTHTTRERLGSLQLRPRAVTISK